MTGGQQAGQSRLFRLSLPLHCISPLVALSLALSSAVKLTARARARVCVWGEGGREGGREG